MGYQEFPWDRGNSRSMDKLRSLFLPVLTGKSVLDVGCNTGFFCGWAAFQKAAHVRGIDVDRNAIETARIYFPECSFTCGDWESISDRTYDVVLCLSAIHYARDFETFVHFLMRHVASNGLLVLELGIARGDTAALVPVERQITSSISDTRLFPTMPMLRQVLDRYAFKFIGKSVPQAGDPTPRHVIHVQHKKPCAVLLLGPHYSGKSSLVSEIIAPNLTRISGDTFFGRVAAGQIYVEESLAALIHYLPGSTLLNCAAIMTKICQKGLLPTLVNAISQQVNKSDFVFDAYIPADYHAVAVGLFEEQGFFVVQVSSMSCHQYSWILERADSSSHDRYQRYLEKKFHIDEEAYLHANPDVAAAVAAGKIPSGAWHYLYFGRKEKRRLT